MKLQMREGPACDTAMSAPTSLNGDLGWMSAFTAELPHKALVSQVRMHADSLQTQYVLMVKTHG